MFKTGERVSANEIEMHAKHAKYVVLTFQVFMLADIFCICCYCFIPISALQLNLFQNYSDFVMSGILMPCATFSH